MQSERITFQGHSGHTLAARLDLPDGPVRASAIFAHCFTCSKDIPAARRIAARLAMQGIAVLRFDFTGLGHSEGEFANTHFTSNVADLVCAADYLANRDMPPRLLIGHSLGGAAVIKAAPDIEGLRAVVTIGAPFEPAHVSNNFGAKLDEIKENGDSHGHAGRSRFHDPQGVSGRYLQRQPAIVAGAIWARLSWCCTHPATPLSGSRTPARFSSRRGTPRAS